MHGSWSAESSGPRWLDRPGIVCESVSEFALSEGTVHLLGCSLSARLRSRGGECWYKSPAGRIRCYLSDGGHHHQSLLSTLLCPESNQHRVIHLCRRRADKISNRVCQNVATFAWCVNERVIQYLSLSATRMNVPLTKGTVQVEEQCSSANLTLNFLFHKTAPRYLKQQQQTTIQKWSPKSTSCLFKSKKITVIYSEIYSFEASSFLILLWVRMKQSKHMRTHKKQLLLLCVWLVNRSENLFITWASLQGFSFIPFLIFHSQPFTFHISRKLNISLHCCTDIAQMHRATEGRWLQQVHCWVWYSNQPGSFGKILTNCRVRFFSLTLKFKTLALS